MLPQSPRPGPQRSFQAPPAEWTAVTGLCGHRGHRTGDLHVTQRRARRRLVRAQLLPREPPPPWPSYNPARGLPAYYQLLSCLFICNFSGRVQGPIPTGSPPALAASSAGSLAHALPQPGSKAGFTFQSGAAPFPPSQRDLMPTANS